MRRWLPRDGGVVGTGPVSLGSSWFEVVGCCCKTWRSSGSLALSGHPVEADHRSQILGLWPWPAIPGCRICIGLYWTMTNGFQPVPIWAHPSSICGARRGPSAVGEFCRSSRRRQSWTCLAPDALRPREMFFPPSAVGFRTQQSGAMGNPDCYLYLYLSIYIYYIYIYIYIYIFDDTWGEFCTLLVGRRVAAVVLLCDRGPRLWDFRHILLHSPLRDGTSSSRRRRGRVWGHRPSAVGLQPGFPTHYQSVKMGRSQNWTCTFGSQFGSCLNNFVW